MLKESKLIVAGEKYGYLLAIRVVMITPAKRRIWLCKCDCGNEVEMLAETLKKKKTGCGCVKNRKNKNIRSSEYHAWNNMLQRCTNKKDRSYKNYGEIGVKVSKAWADSFAMFLEDMGTKPSKKHSLDRFPDKYGNYEKGNCRWATKAEQDRNRTDNVLISYNGMEMIITDWAAYFNISLCTLRSHLKRHNNFEKAYNKYMHLNPPVVKVVSKKEKFKDLRIAFINENKDAVIRFTNGSMSKSESLSFYKLINSKIPYSTLDNRGKVIETFRKSLIKIC